MRTNRTAGRMKWLWGLVGGALLLAAVLAMAIASTAGAARVRRPATTSAAKPAADCQPFSKQPCLLPFPNNLYTKRDRSTPTGVRVNLPGAVMPVNAKGERMSPSQYNRNDGFSPGSAIILHVTGLDNAAAFAKTNPVGVLNMGAEFAKNQPIVVIDQATGRRQLVYAELDANASTPQTTDLMILPGKEFTEGHTYVVALRSLRNAKGHVLRAPAWFEKLRDGKRLPSNERSQRTRYTKIFKALKHARIPRKNLYEAWNFTVGSEKSLTSRLLSIRNDAFAQLGDTNLADGKVQGRAPSYAVTSNTMLHPPAARRPGHVPGAVLPHDVRTQRDDRLPLQLEQARCVADANPRQRRDRAIRVHRPDVGDAKQSIADLALRSRPARLAQRGHRLVGAVTGDELQHDVLR